MKDSVRTREAGYDERLDNFTDAAFAFAVIAAGDRRGRRAGRAFDQLTGALGDIPAFAFGFAVIAMFWSAHVRWRRLRGDGDRLSTLLTVLLIFLTLIYIQPLRGMAAPVGTLVHRPGRRLRRQRRAACSRSTAPASWRWR